MSKSFSWTPANQPPPPDRSLDDRLIELLVRRYWDSSIGDIDTYVANDLELDYSALEFLWGVAYATPLPSIEADSHALIEGIREHGTIRINVTR